MDFVRYISCGVAADGSGEINGCGFVSEEEAIKPSPKHIWADTLGCVKYGSRFHNGF
jgi:hypothetical protein